MATSTANTAKTKAWASLSVRTGTKGDVRRLRSAYMKLRGEDISEETIVRALLKGVTAKDLPHASINGIPGK